MKVKSLSLVQLFATPWTVAHQAPLSMEFSRQDYWNGLPCPSPRDLPDPGTEPGSPTLQADALPSEPQGKPILAFTGELFHFVIFLFLVVAFSFPLREVPLAFVVKLGWFCRILLAFVCKAFDFSVNESLAMYSWLHAFLFHHFKYFMPFLSGLHSFY